MSVLGAVVPDGQGRVRREISIQRLLEWAFADECAQIDFEDAGTLAQGYGHVGNAYRMAQRGVLGCRIDGGGVSYPDPDADLVASAVATLPVECGGRRMAVAVAEFARARRVPDCMADARMCCRPVAWRGNRHGSSAVTEHVEHVIDHSGRKPRRHDVRVCPVTFIPTQAQIGAARRDYLAWFGALLHVRSSFQAHQNLSRWVVSSDMPVMRPWQKRIDE